jgi:hypothetical protein
MVLQVKESLLMNRNIRVMLALGVLAASPAAFAQYTMDLTGVAPNGANSGGVYVSPYQGTIALTSTGTTIYSGYMICDDYTTESYLNTPWTATSTASGALNGSQKFGSIMFEGTTYSVQQAYNAAAWLATQLVLPTNVSNPTSQTNYSFAIWNIFDNGAAGSNAQALALEQTALTGYDNTVQSNVTVYTASTGNPLGINQSQEFLVVNPRAAPEMDVASAGGGLALLLGGLVVLRGRRSVRLDDRS